TRGKEVAHLIDALWRLHVLAGNGATYGRFVHTHHLGNLVHVHRLEHRGTLLEELLLPFYYLDGDTVDGLLPLVDALDQELSTANLITDVILNLVLTTLGHQVLVSVGDAQVRYILVIQGHRIILTHAFHIYIRD